MSDIDNKPNVGITNSIPLYDTQKLIFDNVYGELDFYKKKCDVLEKDLFKSQTQIKKLEITLKKMSDINAVNGKNVNNTSISFLLPSEFKSLWENFAKDLLLEAFDSLYDDYIMLAYVTQDTLQITYEETNLYMKEKVDSVLKILNLNIQIDSTKEIEKFISRFKSIFQDYFNSIFIYTDIFRDKVRDRLLNKIKSYEIFDLDNSQSKLEDVIQDLNKKPFRNLIETLFKLCLYMILHDPVLNFNITKERQLVYNFYNKNELMNIEGFGTDQTPCAVIVPTPMLRKNFAYMGIKPAVYCLQKSQVNDKILAECNKNKPTMLKRNSSADLLAEKGSNINHGKQVGVAIVEKEKESLVLNNEKPNLNLPISGSSTNTGIKPYGASTPSKNSSGSLSYPVKIKNKTSEDLSNINIVQSSTNLVHVNKDKEKGKENQYLLNEKNIQNPQKDQINNINNTNISEKSHHNNSNDYTNTINRNMIPSSGSFVINSYNVSNSSYNYNKIASSQEDDQNLNPNSLLENKNKIPQSGKKCYDRPLIMKSLKKDEEMAIPNKRTYAGSFVNSHKHIDLDTPSLQNYKSNTLNLKAKNNSRSSSIDNSNSNIVHAGSNMLNEPQSQQPKERPVIAHLHLQNIQAANDGIQGIHYTKTTRGINSKNLLETEGNNTNTIPMRYVPTNSGGGFNMIRAKNNPMGGKQGFISDSKRLNSNSVLEKSSHGGYTGHIDYPLKDKSKTIKCDEEENLSCIVDKLDKTPLIERHHERNEEIKRKHLNNYLNHNHGSLNRDTREKENQMVKDSLNNQNMTPMIFNNMNRKNYMDNNGNLKFIGNSYLNLNINSGSAGVHLAKTAPKDRKVESRIFSKTPMPNELFEIRNLDSGNVVKTEEVVINNIDSKGLEIKDNSGISYSNTSENNLTDDMKYNGPKKKRDMDMTPINNKFTQNNLDIKSRVGKIYNDVLQQQKTIDHPSSGGEKSNSNNNIANFNKEPTSPKALNNFSIGEKSAKELKDKKLVFLSNTGKLKFGSSLYSNLQNKALKK